jgi:hypothetical protein
LPGTEQRNQVIDKRDGRDGKGHIADAGNHVTRE